MFIRGLFVLSAVFALSGKAAATTYVDVIVDCDLWLGMGEIIADAIPSDPNFGEWLIELDEQGCSGGTDQYSNTTLENACAAINEDPANSMTIYIPGSPPVYIHVGECSVY